MAVSICPCCCEVQVSTSCVFCSSCSDLCSSAQPTTLHFLCFFPPVALAIVIVLQESMMLFFLIMMVLHFPLSMVVMLSHCHVSVNTYHPTCDVFLTDCTEEDPGDHTAGQAAGTETPAGRRCGTAPLQVTSGVASVGASQ